jgi:hypothetical protein
MRDAIEMARAAGFDITCDPTETPWRTFVEGWEEELKAFEALVRADEREACAKVCEEVLEQYRGTDMGKHAELVGDACANAIRARGQA